MSGATAARWPKWIDRDLCARLADGLAIAAVVSLPWSTSATGILIALWLIVLVPTLEGAALRRVLSTPAGGLPVLLWAIGLIGMLWAADLTLAERLGGLKALHKLLVIPLLIVQFQGSDRGAWVIKGFVASCGVLLTLSWIFFWLDLKIWPFTGGNGAPGIPFKDYITQSAEFTVCVFVLGAVALDMWRQQRRGSAALLSLLAAAFLANVLYVSSGRTQLVVIPVLLLLLAVRDVSWKRGSVGFLLAVMLFGGLAWSVPTVRTNLIQMSDEVSTFRPEGINTRAGERLEFWRKSVGFVASAPFIGHGTGSIADQFRRTVAGESGMAAIASSNPHNQTLAVAIQLGFVGAAVLWAMWFAHVLLFFRGEGLAAWAGLVIAAQNVVGSLFGSLLSDFTSGWGYVIGVGVAAGLVLKQGRERKQL